MEDKTTQPIISNIINDLMRLKAEPLTYDSVDEIIQKLTTIIETLREVEELVHSINCKRAWTKDLEMLETKLEDYLIMNTLDNV